MTPTEKLTNLKQLKTELLSLKAQHQALVQTLLSLQNQIQAKAVELESALDAIDIPQEPNVPSL